MVTVIDGTVSLPSEDRGSLSTSFFFIGVHLLSHSASVLWEITLAWAQARLFESVGATTRDDVVPMVHLPDVKGMMNSICLESGVVKAVWRSKQPASAFASAGGRSECR